ncbi:hypothetical protein MSG28_004897 [Choristoneura fumiferana]|uniref:Uncharacterized protein n=1 Tax=Choristoneura fumiferana TaxID=7141 RepID=A0ACC0JP85_CHOFU|nr:hypothetical protein MSG28_004897 [Choristoneura fumiferana]
MVDGATKGDATTCWFAGHGHIDMQGTQGMYAGVTGDFHHLTLLFLRLPAVVSVPQLLLHGSPLAPALSALAAHGAVDLPHMIVLQFVATLFASHAASFAYLTAGLQQENKAAYDLASATQVYFKIWKLLVLSPVGLQRENEAGTGI